MVAAFMPAVTMMEPDFPVDSGRDFATSAVSEVQVVDVIAEPVVRIGDALI